jgi:hypothetical protein
LLHHVEETEVVDLATSAQVHLALRKKLGGYNKNKLKVEHFSADSVTIACARSQRLDEAVGGGKIPAGNSSRVYLLWKAIVAKAQGTQLPVSLKNLI